MAQATQAQVCRQQCLIVTTLLFLALMIVAGGLLLLWITQMGTLQVIQETELRVTITQLMLTALTPT